jgi:hypothetical protein
MQEEFVYDAGKDGSFEVRKTGRIATRQLGANKPTHEVVEITPVDPDIGTWTRWVNPTILFKIQK